MSFFWGFPIDVNHLWHTFINHLSIYLPCSIKSRDAPLAEVVSNWFPKDGSTRWIFHKPWISSRPISFCHRPWRIRVMYAMFNGLPFTINKNPSHVSIYTYIHTYVRTYVRTYIHTYVRTYIHTYIHYIHILHVDIQIPIYSNILWMAKILKHCKQWNHNEINQPTSGAGFRNHPQYQTVKTCKCMWMLHNSPAQWSKFNHPHCVMMPIWVG